MVQAVDVLMSAFHPKRTFSLRDFRVCVLPASMFARRHPIFATLLTAALALILWTAWRSTDLSLPPLARGTRWADDGRTIFQQRIMETYPIGSSEEALLRDLRNQGFAIKRGRDLSKAEVYRFIGCGSRFWSVRWKAEKGRLTWSYGVLGAVCV